MADNLVIVESPAKAKTIKKYLGSNYEIEASLGHIRDLPENTLGVDIENGFRPHYEELKNKHEIIKTLKKKAAGKAQILLATDPDREGEAISWHLAHILGLGEKEKCRIEFQEITERAVREAVSHPREILQDMVNSQQARRILDRIVGYKISPLLWKKVKMGLSAGRVQSVAVKLICERERKIEQFVPSEFWNILLDLSKIKRKDAFQAKYYGNESGKVKISDGTEAAVIAGEVEQSGIMVKSVKKSKKSKHPSPPFITSTLQQEAANKLGFTTQQTMRVAQQLYEGVEIRGAGSIGLITYMRTDSTRISPEVQQEARRIIESLFGPSFVPKAIPVYKNKNNTQDAHEAIRPACLELFPNKIRESLATDQFRLYKLICDRFFASQMASAEFDTVQVDTIAGKHWFKSSGSINTFKGFLSVYDDSNGNEAEIDKDDSVNESIPELTKGEHLEIRSIKKEQKFTQPPLRFTEASLVKALEEMGIGRPSTYAPTIFNIISRDYVVRDKKHLIPTELGKLVDSIMNTHFGDIVDYRFTAELENKLDAIENGELDWKAVLFDFYRDFDPILNQASKTLEKVKVPDIISDEICEKCGKPMVVKSGKYGKFLACPMFPECRNSRPYASSSGNDPSKNSLKAPNPEEAGESGAITSEKCEKCGNPMVIKVGQFGKFLACTGFPKCRNSRPIYEETGKTCPNCSKKVVYKYTKKKRRFIGCEGYPECNFFSWLTPSDLNCPKCGSFLLTRKKNGEESSECSRDSCPSRNDSEQKNSGMDS